MKQLALVLTSITVRYCSLRYLTNVIFPPNECRVSLFLPHLLLKRCSELQICTNCMGSTCLNNNEKEMCTSNKTACLCQTYILMFLISSGYTHNFKTLIYVFFEEGRLVYQEVGL
jgi:hypothetical protein